MKNVYFFGLAFVQSISFGVTTLDQTSFSTVPNVKNVQTFKFIDESGKVLSLRKRKQILFSIHLSKQPVLLWTLLDAPLSSTPYNIDKIDDSETDRAKFLFNWLNFDTKFSLNKDWLRMEFLSQSSEPYSEYLFTQERVVGGDISDAVAFPEINGIRIKMSPSSGLCVKILSINSELVREGSNGYDTNRLVIKANVQVCK